MFSKGGSRHVSATRASRFVRCRSAQQGKQYALLPTPSSQAQLPRFSIRFPSISTITAFRLAHFAPKSPNFMRQTTKIWPKCAPALSTFHSNLPPTPVHQGPSLHRWPPPSHFLVNSLPFVDPGAILVLTPRPRRVNEHPSTLGKTMNGTLRPAFDLAGTLDTISGLSLIHI